MESSAKLVGAIGMVRVVLLPLPLELEPEPLVQEEEVVALVDAPVVDVP